MIFLKFIFPILLIAHQFSYATNQDQTSNSPTHKLYGGWDNVQNYCKHTRTGSFEVTRLFKVPFIEFEPQVHLEIYQNESQDNNGNITTRGDFVKKSVRSSSCKYAENMTGDLITSTYEMSFAVNTQFEAPIYKSTAVQFVNGTINRNEIAKCGQILKFLTGLRFPKYFKTEAERGYSLRIINGFLYLQFIDDEICPGDEVQTVMVFKREH